LFLQLLPRKVNALAVFKSANTSLRIIDATIVRGRIQNIKDMQTQFQADPQQYEDEIAEMERPNYGLKYSEEQEDLVQRTTTSMKWKKLCCNARGRRNKQTPGNGGALDIMR
jgi:hypothetical protein